MLNLWVPGETSADEYDELGAGEARMAHCEEFCRYLKQIDSRLDLVFAKAHATWTPHPGRWHIIRRNEGAPWSFWAVLAEDGESYSEPYERHLQALKARDSAANPRLWEEHRKAVARERLDRQLRADERHAQFREGLSDRLDHLFDARIATDGAAGSTLERILGAAQATTAPTVREAA